MNPVARFCRKLQSWRHRRFVVAGNRFREGRLLFFVEHIDSPGETILDVGYGYGQFEDQLTQFGVSNKVIALDIVPRDTSRHANVAAFVVADAAHLPFADGSVDIIYCNSLLEHVGAWEVQRQVFAGIERVGRKFFVQTPNRHFPIEPHHLLPFFQYLPHSVQRWIGNNVIGHYEQVWLQGRKAMQQLACVGRGIAVWEEKVLGLTKSFVLHRRHPSGRRE